MQHQIVNIINNNSATINNATINSANLEHVASNTKELKYCNITIGTLNSITLK